MNRISGLFASSESNPVNSSMGSGLVADSSVDNLCDRFAPASTAKSSTGHLLYAPQHYEGRYDYPLLVWLHGSRSSEREIEYVMPEVSLRNYVGVAPRGTKALEACGHRYTWAHTPASIALAEELVYESIEAAREEFSINTDRIFLAGFGDGGTMAWRIGLRNAEQFAGVASICGRFPKQHRPLARLHSARRLKTMWMVGSQSRTCGSNAVCEELPMLQTAGLKVAIRQYNCGDDLYTDMLSDLNKWMMSIVNNTPMVEPQPEPFANLPSRN